MRLNLFYFFMLAAFLPLLSNCGPGFFLDLDGSSVADSGSEERAALNLAAWPFWDGDQDNGLNINPAEHSRDPALVSCDGSLYLAWFEGGATEFPVVSIYTGTAVEPQWTKIGGPGYYEIRYDDTKDTVGSPSIQCLSNKVYLVWAERTATVNQVRVAVFDGTVSVPHWSFVDGGAATGLNNNSARAASTPHMITFNGKLYLNWTESNGTRNVIFLRVYNGNDLAPAWTSVNTPGVDINYTANKGASNSQLGANAGKLYVAWQEQQTASSAVQVHVRVYNGNDGSPGWSLVDGAPNSLNYDSTASATGPQFGSKGGVLYCSFGEKPVGLPTILRIKVYNGNDSSPSWSPAEGTGTGLSTDSANNIERRHFFATTEDLYLIWEERRGASPTYTTIRIHRLDDTTSPHSWVRFDGTSESGLNRRVDGFPHYPDCAYHDSRIYCSFAEERASDQMDQLRVRVGEPHS